MVFKSLIGTRAADQAGLERHQAGGGIVDNILDQAGAWLRRSVKYLDQPDPV